MLDKATLAAAIPVFALLLTAVSCGGESPTTTQAEAGRTDDSAVTPSVPLLARTADDSGGSLPSDHPPIGDDPQAAIPAPPPGSGSGAAGLVWTAPGGWIEETPSSGMRRAQYRVPGEAGDAECVVFYFGPGQGGDAMANAARWAGQFEQADGRSSTDVMQTTEMTVAGSQVLMVEVTGTYSNPMVMDEKKPGYMLLGAIAEGPDANWFFKLTGPEATVLAERKAFEGMIRSLHAGS